MPQSPPSPKDIKRFHKARKELESGNPEKAIHLFRQVLSSWENNADIWYLIGLAYGKLGQSDQVIQAAEESLALDPNHVASLGNLAKAQYLLGENAEALKTFERAMSMQPDNLFLIDNYAIALCNDNKKHQAITILKKTLSQHPDFVPALASLGLAHAQLGNIDTAIEYYKQALEIEPASVNANIGLADIMLTLSNFPYAEELYSHALKAEPFNIAAQIGKSWCLFLLGKASQAQKILDKADKLLPDNTNILCAKANILEHRGKPKEAFEILDRLQSEDRLTGIGASSYANLSARYDKQELALEQIDKALSNPATSMMEKKLLHFSAGKLYDKLKRYEEAFEHYTKANSYTIEAYDEEREKAHINELISTFSKDNISHYMRATTDSRRPVFIVGMPRSGTTLTEQILASHNQVFGAGELGSMNRIVRTIRQPLSKDTTLHDILRKLDSSGMTDLAQSYLDDINKLNTTSRYVTDKMPHNFMHLGFINLMFPNARVVYCKRNPLDNILSIYFQNFTEWHSYAHNLIDIGAAYREHIRLMQHWTEVLDIPIMTLNYEDIVMNQEESSRQLLDFCGLQWDDSVLGFHKSARDIKTASYDQVTQPLYHHSVSRWRNYENQMSKLVELFPEYLEQDIALNKEKTHSKHP